MEVEIKRGDTFDHFASFELIAEDGALLDPSGWTPTSQVLFGDGSRQTLTVTKIGDATEYGRFRSDVCSASSNARDSASNFCWLVLSKRSRTRAA